MGCSRWSCCMDGTGNFLLVGPKRLRTNNTGTIQCKTGCDATPPPDASCNPGTRTAASATPPPPPPAASRKPSMCGGTICDGSSKPRRPARSYAGPIRTIACTRDYRADGCLWAVFVPVLHKSSMCRWNNLPMEKSVNSSAGQTICGTGPNSVYWTCNGTTGGWEPGASSTCPTPTNFLSLERLLWLHSG